MPPRHLSTRSEQLDQGNCTVIIKCVCAQAYTPLHNMKMAPYTPYGVSNVFTQGLTRSLCHTSLPKERKQCLLSSGTHPCTNWGIPAFQGKPASSGPWSMFVCLCVYVSISLHCMNQLCVCAYISTCSHAPLCWLSLLTRPV